MVKDFNLFKNELQDMLRSMEREHAAKCEEIEKYIDKYFHEWANGEKEQGLFLPDLMMTLVVLRLSEAEDKIREAQVCMSQKWYDGIASNYMLQFREFVSKAQFMDGKLINNDRN